MRVIILGLGVQGYKRRDIAGADCVCVVDPYNDQADYTNVEDVPLDSFDAALVCTPDDAKFEILNYLLSNKKHVLVEKPLLTDSQDDIKQLAAIAQSKGVCCYTAYNHRFEPHFMRMKTALESGNLGQVYSVRMFYGNGTARLVRDSAWRDKGAGVLPDLGSHLLDTILFWLGKPDEPFKAVVANCFENKAPDHCIIASFGDVSIQLEMTLLSWRNHFTADIFAEKGSAHITSLCKWGPSEFIQRTRILPSGRPTEENEILEQADPTWALEYEHFKTLCASGKGNLENDMWINSVLQQLSADIAGGELV